MLGVQGSGFEVWGLGLRGEAHARAVLDEPVHGSVPKRYVLVPKLFETFSYHKQMVTRLLRAYVGLRVCEL